MPTLEFKGKQHIYAHHLTVPHRPLIVDPAKSFPKHQNRGGGGTPVLSSALPDDNLIIHGDNLHALKALLPRYAGKVNCIYIDPPYNTGSQAWVYNDNVNSPLMQRWFAENAPVDDEDLERHDKWLCMMWVRLQLLRELLAEDGVIYVSIDDHEQHHLRLIMDEIFGEDCFLTCIAAVVNLKGSRDNRGFTNTHEYILAYERVPRGSSLGELPLTDDELDEWREDEVGWFKRGASLQYSGENAPREKRPNLYYPIYISEAGRISVERGSDADEELWPLTADGKQMTWRWSREAVQANPDEIIASHTAIGWTLHKKQRPPVGAVPTRKPKTTLYAPSYSATTATTTVKAIFDNNRVFDYPKAPDLIRDLLRIAGTPPDGIVLDSFAGSGTTAQAVLALNAIDAGNRRFILAECERYADDITAERIRRVINGGLHGSFTYCTLGEPLDLETMLRGDSLPPYAELAAYLLYTATGVSVDGAELKRRDDGWFFGDESTDYYLFYEPDLEWLQSNDAVFTEEQAKRIRAAGPGHSAVVFAAGKFIGQRELSRMNITFCQLPYELHRAGG